MTDRTTYMRDTDTLMSDHEDASRLRRRGWRVIPPDNSGMHPCLGDRCADADRGPPSLLLVLP